MQDYSLEDKLYTLADLAQLRLTSILKKIPDTKDLIIQDTLFKPLDLIIGVSKLNSCNVTKIYKLFKGDAPVTNSQRVFLVTSDLITVKHVCDKINSEINSNGSSSTSYHIILACRKLGSINRLIEEEGLHGKITLHAFQWELVQIDSKVLTLENSQLFRQLYVDGDQSFLPSVARSIWSLQMLIGKPLTTICVGRFSCMVSHMIQLMLEELGTPDCRNAESSTLIIIDRDVDYVTPLRTGATYTCLLDEVFSINSKVVNIRSSSDKSTPLILNSSCKIYSQIKSRHFSDVYSFLSAKTKELTKEVDRSKNMEIHEMKKYVTEELRSVTQLKMTLATHIEACEGIIRELGDKFEALEQCESSVLEGRNRKANLSYIEETLAMSLVDKFRTLRLLCLFSLTQDGLPSSEYHSLKMQFLHRYGYQHLTTFFNLEKLGLFTESTGLIGSEYIVGAITNKVVQAVPLTTRRSNFLTQALNLKLFPPVSEDFDLKCPQDVSYVFGGAYIPIACRLAQILIKKEMTMDELSKLLPNTSIRSENPGGTPLSTLVVYFIGGVTYAEVAAFQLLEKLSGIKIVVAGTSIINGNTLVKSCI